MHRDRMALNGDPALTLEIHRVQVLRSQNPLRYRRCVLEQTVRQSRLPMVDMGYDTKIALVVRFHESGRTCSLLSSLSSSEVDKTALMPP
jgi:hypothetical protein